jgi:integrase
LINTNGSKWWRFRFQFDGKAKMMSLGTYPDVSLATVRKKLAEARELVAQGINPIESKDTDIKAIAGSLTFKKVSDAFLAYVEPNISIHHYKRSESLLRLYALPVLKNHPVDTITHLDVQRIIVALNDSGKTESAKKLYGVMKQIFDYAVLREHCPVNICNLVPIKSITKDTVKRNFSTITEPIQIKQLIENIKSFESGHWSTKQGLLFMAYTSLRSANIRHARWEQIDFENHTMTIAKEEMKIEKRKLHQSEDFILPLAMQTIDLLNEAKQFSGHGKYIFPSIRGDRAMSENAMLVFVRALGYTKEQFTPHGFRAMFATIANEEDNGFDRDLIDAQLAHKVGGSVSQSYNRTDYFNRRIALAQWWADWLDLLSSK